MTVTTELATEPTNDLGIESTLDFVRLPLADVEPNPDQPRKFFDEAKLEELAAQFRSVGQAQAIVVRPAGDKYQIVMGERRWRAMHLVEGATTIKAEIVQSVDDEKSYILGISENIGRADMTLMEEAQAYADLVGFGYAPERIAEMFGKTKDYVTWRMDLLELTTEVAKLVENGTIKADFAWYLSRLTPANQKVATLQYMKGNFKTETDACNFAQALKLSQDQEGFFTEKELTEAEKEEKAKARTKARSLVEQLEAIAAKLDELGQNTPTELADLFEGGVGRHTDALDRVHKSVSGLRTKMRKAKSISAARSLAVRADLEVEPEGGAVDEEQVVVAGEAGPTEAELVEIEAEEEEVAQAA
uniref:ParB/RepB/Spo0J family partition protein n=1 Tax=Streptomyces sp. NBC_00003 TaxID=2903608 RepID=A0AAU2V6Q2_9ACTN